MRKNLIFATFVGVLVVGGLFFYKRSTSPNEEAVMGVKTRSVIRSTQPTTRPILKDDSFSAIDIDLNNTVIFNEDFSDL